MGTRSTILFRDYGKDICKVYQQYDGYLSGVGKELADFLTGIVIGNGIGGNCKLGEFANGMGCLSAQFIAKFKTECGQLYMVSLDDEEEFNYIVEILNGVLRISVNYCDETFSGTLEEFKELIRKEDE